MSFHIFLFFMEKNKKKFICFKKNYETFIIIKIEKRNLCFDKQKYYYNGHNKNFGRCYLCTTSK